MPSREQHGQRHPRPAAGRRADAADGARARAALARAEARERGELGPVLVAERQEEERVLDGVEAQLGEELGALGADALEELERRGEAATGPRTPRVCAWRCRLLGANRLPHASPHAIKGAAPANHIDPGIAGVSMAQRCDVCGKGPSVGNKISHAHKVTKRRWLPNLVSMRAMVERPAAARARVHPLPQGRQGHEGRLSTEKTSGGGCHRPPPARQHEIECRWEAATPHREHGAYLLLLLLGSPSSSP